MIEVHKPDEALTRLLPQVQLRTDTLYVPSQFTLSFMYKQKRYVFNVLTKQCIEACLPQSARAGESYDDLIAAQFLVPADKDECAYYNSISALMRAYNRKKGWRQYTILPTSSCNARCIYCFEAGIKPITMTADVVAQTIRYIRDSHAGDQVELAWFGGEPLLGEGIIDRICAGVRDNDIEFESSMITNGSLITPAIIDKMKSSWNLNEIQVSMDGAEVDYIFRKNYYSNHDHYRAVMNAVSLMSAAGIKVMVRCNVDEDNWNSIPRFIEDLETNVKDKTNVRLYLSPLYDVRRSEHDLELWEKINEARDMIESAGFRPASFEGTSMRFRVFSCMADSVGVTISPDGGLYACDQLLPESRFGDIWHGITDESARNEFCRVDKTREKCRTCTFLPDCTSFASCPVVDCHCRELREMKALEALKLIIDKKESEGTEEDHPVC